MHQFSESQTKVPWSAIILKIVIFIRICMVNGKACCSAHLPYKTLYKLQFLNWGCFAILWCMTLTIGPLTTCNFGLLFLVVPRFSSLLLTIPINLVERLNINYFLVVVLLQQDSGSWLLWVVENHVLHSTLMLPKVTRGNTSTWWLIK